MVVQVIIPPKRYKFRRFFACSGGGPAVLSCTFPYGHEDCKKRRSALRLAQG
jgi:hypothetical protein